MARAAKAGTPAVRSVVHFPARGPGGQNSHACFWGVSYTQETRNIIWPDSHTDYPVSIDTIPAGGKIVLHGRFPHARFFSLTTSSVLGVIRGHLYDTSIKPDAGSVNPFLPGANRAAARRSYTITVVDQPDPGPGHEAPNTLYGGIAGQAPGAGPLLIVERVYLPDQGRDFSGGVGEPAASYVAADGTISIGQAACTTLQTKAGASNLIDVNKLLFPLSKMTALLGQLRYWSICNNEGLTSGKTTGPCLADEEVPINAHRQYTVVLSLPQDRPANATDACGVAWMNWGTTGDGYTRPRSTMILLRNLTTTAHPAFPNAVQNITTPATVKQTMGQYLPTVTYTDAAKFKHLGCNSSGR